MIGGDGLWRLVFRPTEGLWWVPIAAVAATTLLGLLAAYARPRGPARGVWAMLVLICGFAAVAVTASQQAAIRDMLRQETARLEELGARLDELGRLLPQGAGRTHAETFDSAAAAIRSLSARIEELQQQVRAAEERYRTRRIEPETAGMLAAYLRQHGPHRVVVSTVPGDIEAFTYANQIANVLRDAGWDALGPETTTIFGMPAANGIRLFARNAAPAPEAAKALMDAFTRFNIPYRSGVAPSDAIPDTATVELFISRKS